jgi:flagellar motor protein MotB
LYIFVVCVIALKGANLDLTEVLSKDKVVERSYADSLKKYIDSLLALGLVPRIEIDTTRQSMAELQQKLEILRTQIASVSVTTTSAQLTQTQPELKQQDPEKEKVEIKEQPNVSPVVAQQLQQYRANTVSNRGNLPLEIYADGSLIASVPPNGSQTFTLMGQSSVTFKSGGQSSTASTIQNKQQSVTILNLAPSGENASIRQIQSVTAFRVNIDDDFPDQLEVSFKGPVSVTQKGNSYDVKVNLINSKEQFDRFTEGKDSPYQASFTVTVTDKLSKKSVSRMGTISFGEW